MIRLSKQIVEDFSKHMLSEYNAYIVDKSDSTMMSAVGWMLQMFGSISRTDFLSKYATTINNKIYMPYTLGSDAVPLERQVEVLVHELEHVEQWRSIGAGYYFYYVLDHEKRAHFETEAMETELEMHWFLHDELLSVAYLSSRLNVYGCTSRDISVSHKHLFIYSQMVAQGIVGNEVSRTAIEWLKEHA